MALWAAMLCFKSVLALFGIDRLAGGRHENLLLFYIACVPAGYALAGLRAS